jgi:flagellar protein FliO/FliZ
MQRFIFILIGSLFCVCRSWSIGYLQSVVSTNDQDVFRLELQFDSVVDPNKVGMQFTEKNLIITIPEANFKRATPSVESKSSFIDDVRFTGTKDKTITIEIQFAEVTALQMKENLAMEGLGKSLIIEVLPPMWNKGIVQDSPPAIVATQVADKEAVMAVAAEPVQDEKQIPLFEKKNKLTTESSGLGKIVFMVCSVLALGGYLIWWLKNRSKMVNGPESLMKIKVVTQFHLGPKKTLAVVRVAGESLLLGITETQIGLIKTLSLLDDELPEVSGENFANTLEEQERPKVKRERLSNLDVNADEEFSFGPAVKTSLSQKIPMLRKII